MTQQETLGLDTVSQGLLRALMADEEAITAAHREWSKAYTNFDIISRRYAAMREAVRERLGVSPYSQNVHWPPKETGRFPPPPVLPHTTFPFRYVRMKIGDAIVEVLAEATVPLTVEEIGQALGQGGLSTRDARAVNAALINMKGVGKSSNGQYKLIEEPPTNDDIDDLPF